MVDPGTVGTLLVAAVASFFMAWTIGAGSSGSTPFAPAVGANAIGVMRAGFVVGVLGFLGAVVQGGNVSEAVGRELISDATLSAVPATIALLVAATLVALGLFKGYPIATAFTVTGAVIGVGLALGGTPAWTKYRQIVGLWVAVPFVGGSAAYLLAVLLQSEHRSEERVVPILAGFVGLVVANIEFVFFGPSDVSQSIAAAAGAAFPTPAVATVPLASVGVSGASAVAFASLVAVDLDGNVATGQRHFLLALGGFVAFSAGGSQVGLAIGPLLPLVSPLAVPLTGLLVGGGLGLLVGSWTGAPRLIKALSRDYSSLGPQRSIAALIPAFVIAQTAILLGVPVSFNEIIVSTIVGSGATAETAEIGRRKIVYTALAWAGSLALAIALGFGLYTAFTLL